MNQEHPITPPPELVVEWADTIYQQTECDDQRDLYVATQAARWGADQQLEQCEKYWMTHGISPEGVVAMRYALRPKPPSLKEQSLDILKYPKDFWSEDEVDTIRRALEALPE